jgi:hypothetical protein
MFGICLLRQRKYITIIEIPIALFMQEHNALKILQTHIAKKTIRKRRKNELVLFWHLRSFPLAGDLILVTIYLFIRETYFHCGKIKMILYSLELLVHLRAGKEGICM